MRSPLALSLLLAGCLFLVSCKTSSSSPSAGGSGAAASAEGTPRTSPDLIANYEKLADDILETREREVKIVRSILDATYEDAKRSLDSAQKSLASGDNAAAKDHIEDLAMLVGYMATEGDGSVARVRKKLVEGGHHFNPLLNQPAGTAGAHEGSGHHAGDKGHHAGDKGADEKAHHADGQGHAKDKGHHAAGQGEQPAKEGGAPQEKAHHAGSTPHHAGGQHGEAHHGDAEGSRGYDPGYVIINRGAKKTLMDANRALAKLAAAPSLPELEKEWKKVEETWAKVRG